MQEEVEQRVVTLIINCSKLTEQELRKALGKFLAQIKTKHQNKQPHGKMTVNHHSMGSYHCEMGRLPCRCG